MPKEILRNQAVEEILRCARDPVYYINNYCKIRHPHRGLIGFKLYKYQEEAIHNFLSYDKNIINKARQLGYSTLMAAFISWLILFHKDKEVLVVATKKEVSTNLLKKVKLILKHLPDWMYLCDVTINQAHTLGLSNGSSIKSIPRSDDAGRSESLALLIIDEAAHIRDMDELWKGLASTVATGGKAIALSTPKGVSNWFHSYCKKAQSGEVDWHYQEVYWWDNPDYAEDLEDDLSVPGGKTSSWFRNMTEGWTNQQIAQELLTSFTETGDTYFEASTIEAYEKMTLEPIEKIGIDKGFWVYKKPEKDKKYILAADVASGTAEDNSTFVIMEVEDMEIVGEFKGKVPPDVFAEYIINEICPLYNNPLVIPENNNIGMVSAYTMRNLEYKKLAYIEEKNGKLVDKWYAQYNEIQPGWRTTAKNRPIILQKLEEFLRKGLIKSYSKRMVNEMLSFVWKNGKPQARKGENDDLIMALAIAVWIHESYFAHSSKKEDVISMYDSVIVNRNSSEDKIPNAGNALIAEKQRIRKIVENQKSIRVGNAIINMDWIYKQ